MKILISILFFYWTSTAVFAQKETISTPINKKVDWTHFEKELEKESKSFYRSKNGAILFIDFKILGEKMERLELKSNENKVIYTDNNLFDLPDNTIYELNLEKLERGSYFVELSTFEDNIIHKKIIIN